MTGAVPCPHHAGPSGPPEVVRLWDGRDHCRACVDAACPGLREFARGRDSLVDSIPYDRSGGLLELGKFAGLSYGVLALAGVGFLAALDVQTTLVLIGLIALCLAFSMLMSLPKVFLARSVLPTVRVRDGVVDVFRPHHAGGDRPIATLPLSETRWHLGPVREDNACRGRGGALVPNNPAVILRRPRIWKNVIPPSEFIATGSTPEMVRYWRGFLRLAGVPEGR